MNKKDFKLKPHSGLTRTEVEFLTKFTDPRDKNVLALAFTAGVTEEEMEALGIDQSTELSRKEEAALFARYQYKCSHSVAQRIMDEHFDDTQLDTIMSVLLLPTFGMAEDKLLNEVLFAHNSMDDMLEWFNKNMATAKM